MRRSILALVGFAVGAGCSFDTASLISGGPVDASEASVEAAVDAASDIGVDAVPDASIDSAIDSPSEARVDVPVDIGVDAPMDVRPDAPADVAAELASDAPTDEAVDAATSAAGLWRVTQISFLGFVYRDSSSPSRVNGLVRLSSDSVSIAFAFATADRPHLQHGALGFSCVTPRAMDFTGRALLGNLSDARNTFTVTEGMTPETVPLTRVDDHTITFRYPPMGGVDLTIQRLGPVAPRNNYSGSAEIDFADDTCPDVVPADTRQYGVLLWERAGGGPAIPVAAPTPLVRTVVARGSSAQVPVHLTAAPPPEAIQRVDGVGAAIAYIVVFVDLNGNGTLDHAYTGLTDAGAGDQVIGVSNVAIAWRDVGVHHTGAEQSSFIDTYDGYQTVAIGPDSRSNGGTAPWAVDSTTHAPTHAGCFADDPTIPIIASGTIQQGTVTDPLPHLLR